MGKCMFLRKGEVHTVPSKLPTGFTALEYIRSTGTQYINTGFTPTANTQIDATFEVDSGIGNKNLFGGDNTSYVFNSMTDTSVEYAVGDSGWKTVTVSPITVKFSVSMNKSHILYNGAEIASLSGRTITSVNPLCIFVRYRGSAYSSAKLYAFKVYENGTLVRDFQPCMNASGTVGLYDLVGKKFYGNAGTGVFLSNLDIIVAITADNIGDYFTVTNGRYYFKGSGAVFTSNNAGKASSTASTILTAKQDISVLAFGYSYSSEAKYDKFTLKVGGTTVENGVSGATTNKTYSGSLAKGQTVEFTYTKDSSQNANDDKCTFSNMYITIKGAA